MSRARIKDIAAALGVSPATVSRALSDSGLVAEPTRSRIREAARRLNYRPNVSARNLRTQRSMAVLLVVRDVGNPFYLDIMKGVEAAAREAGYSVLMGNTENNPEREIEYFNMLRDGHADGMILITGKLPEDDVLPQDLAALPVVVALEPIEHSGFPHVMIDNTGAAREAVEHLISLGHKRIAHIAGPVPETMATLRREGYRRAMGAAGLKIPAGYEVIGDYLLPSGERLCRELFSLPEPPTAIFAANDEMAFGAINELRVMGLGVPGDVSVVGFDDIFLSQAFYPPLTTVSQPRIAIGREAMRLLLEVMRGESHVGEIIMMPTAFQTRGSTAPMRGRRSHRKSA
ncbi:LacI family DNA-binding transcriptional regulator [Chelativorans sp. AA-79]|uniref:LacI family DNA-binding transcriptional regulator n=1 Tax=Chelativorans sp. AA-79 TaxID=3028735 RepID=UPI0023F797F1|nr:LacI family DNA-binding transcriptional regulator [Chelativorans sp. AA-79]WEX08766.1 LacI family DNA-binding transcriptional regulator [Chelativorans sp. AA-79]